MPFSRHRSETERPESYSLSIEIIWVSVKRDFFIVSKFSEFMVVTDSVFGDGYGLDHHPREAGLHLKLAEMYRIKKDMQKSMEHQQEAGRLMH